MELDDAGAYDSAGTSAVSSPIAETRALLDPLCVTAQLDPGAWVLWVHGGKKHSHKDLFSECQEDVAGCSEAMQCAMLLPI